MRFFTGLIIAALLLASAGLLGCGASTHSAPQPKKAAAPRQPVYYEVRSGDTLRSIAESFKVSSRSVAELNRLGNRPRIYVGSRLLVGYRAGKEGKLVAARLSGTGAAGAVVPARQGPGGKGGELHWPVLVGRLVSGFGPRSGSFHDGIDISCAEGTPVYASHSGTVVYSGDRLSGYGNIVILRHSSGLTTIYAHNSRVFVSTGDRVRRGENISRVGSTGHSSGPHLHFEVRTRDRQDRYVAVDPMPLLNGEPQAKPRYRVNEGLSPILARLFN